MTATQATGRAYDHRWRSMTGPKGRVVHAQNKAIIDAIIAAQGPVLSNGELMALCAARGIADAHVDSGGAVVAMGAYWEIWLRRASDVEALATGRGL